MNTPTNQPHGSRKLWPLRLLVITIITLLSLLIGFSLGFLSSLLSSPGEYAKAATLGFKSMVMLSAAVLTIGTVSLAMKRARYPAWAESITAFAFGFGVMNGVKSYLMNTTDQLWSEMASGWFIGACVGLGLYVLKNRRQQVSPPDPSIKSSK